MTISFETTDHISSQVSIFFLYKASIKLNKICETLYFDSGYIFSISHTEAIISAFGNHDFFLHIFIYELILYIYQYLYLIQTTICLMMDVRVIAMEKVDSWKYNVRKQPDFRCIVITSLYIYLLCTYAHINTQTIHTNMDVRHVMLP